MHPLLSLLHLRVLAIPDVDAETTPRYPRFPRAWDAIKTKFDNYAIGREIFDEFIADYKRGNLTGGPERHLDAFADGDGNDDSLAEPLSETTMNSMIQGDLYSEPLNEPVTLQTPFDASAYKTSDEEEGYTQNATAAPKPLGA